MKNPIWQWQSAIYQHLKHSKELIPFGVGTFTYIPQNTKFPYIRLDKIIMVDNSTKTHKGFNLINEIHIYCEEKGNKQAIILSNIVRELLESGELSLKYYQLIYVILLSCHISQLKEGNISKATLKFKSIIEE